MAAKRAVQFPPNSSGFTLFEIVVVLAILSILVTVSLGLLLDGRTDSLEARAKADIQVIQQGLEAYKGRFGDYPQIPDDYGGLGAATTPEYYLLNALFGRIGPTHQAISGVPVMLNPSILEFANRDLPLKDEAVPSDALKANAILDPWGNAYVYDYRPQDSEWQLFGYTLLSLGVDGSAGTSDDIEAE